MLYQPKNPIGYQNLLTWKQAGEIYHRTKDFTSRYLDKVIDRRLVGHMDDSARSVQRNIEEGFKRATTKEYIEFLGFSRASLEELKGDFEELKREWGEGIRWNKGHPLSSPVSPSSPLYTPISPYSATREKVMREIGVLLDLIYGEDCMMGRQIASLENKMIREKTAPRSMMIKKRWESSTSGEKKFWKTVKDRFGIDRDDRGVMRDKKGANP